MVNQNGLVRYIRPWVDNCISSRKVPKWPLFKRILAVLHYTISSNFKKIWWLHLYPVRHLAVADTSRICRYQNSLKRIPPKNIYSIELLDFDLNLKGELPTLPTLFTQRINTNRELTCLFIERCVLLLLTPDVKDSSELNCVWKPQMISLTRNTL